MTRTAPGPTPGLAIVTGAARNIGRAIALALAHDGAPVLLVAKSNRAGLEETAKLVERAGGEALPHLVDLTDEAAATGMVAAALAWNGPPRALVNNAALRKIQPFCEMTLSDWREVMAVNLEAAFLCARACLPHMVAAGGGRIVNIGGKSGHAGASERAHVIASKAALVGLTKALAVEFGDRGISVNCVVPGEIDTVRGASAGAIPDHPGGRATLIGRRGRPAEVARVVASLCHPDAGYVTGQTVHVNGGGYLP